ncbi:hypothetical protein MKW98_020378, partial [Papaver atlanticum]
KHQVLSGCNIKSSGHQKAKHPMVNECNNVATSNTGNGSPSCLAASQVPQQNVHNQNVLADDCTISLTGKERPRQMISLVCFYSLN